MRLKVVELEEVAQKSARRKAEAAQEVRAKDDPLALLRCRRNLRPRRQADPHEVGVGQAPGLAEEFNMVLVDIGAVPGAATRKMRRWRDTRPCRGKATVSQGGWRKSRAAAVVLG